MTYTVKISEDSDITLTTGVYAISYTPKSGGAAKTVIESSTVRIMASSVATTQAAIRNIEKAFENAKARRATGSRSRVYVKLTEDGDSDTYRSELWAENPDDLPGRVVILEPTMYSRMSSNYKALVEVIWERRNYWDLDAEVELSLANGTGSGTGGRIVTCIHETPVIDDSTLSFDDSTSYITDGGAGWDHAIGEIINVRDSVSNDGIYSLASVDDSSSWVETNEALTNEAAGATIEIYDINDYTHIAAANITGSMPTPVKLKMTQGDSDETTVETMWLGLMHSGTPTEFPHLLEFEDSDDSTAISSDASCSGTEKKTYSVTTTETKIAWWTLPASMISAANSGRFKALVRFGAKTDITNVKLRLKLSYNSATVWSGKQVEYDNTYGTNSNWRELDTIRLPHFDLNSDTPTPLVLEVWAVSTSGSSETPSLDCIKLVGADGFRKLVSTSSIAYNSVLVDDGILDDYYQLVGGAKVKDITAEGSPLMLYPGRDNRIYYTWTNADGNDIDYRMTTFTVQAYYRPRKATL